MAGHTAHLRNDVKHAVAVAIESYFVQLLHIARLLTLAPQLAARTREINPSPCNLRFMQRFGIGPSKHQHAPAFKILRHHGNKPVGVELHLVDPILCHNRTVMPFSAMYFLA